MDLMPSNALSQLLIRYIGLSENGVAVLNNDNVFLFHNPAFTDMFGFNQHSMIGRHFDDMMTWMFFHRSGANIKWPTLESWLEHVHSRHRSAPSRSFEVDLLDGRWLLLNEQIQPGGEMIMICTDITRQKQVEYALKDAQANLERLALTDELTGISNRRHFMQRLSQEVERSRRYDYPVCLAMLDLDNFKTVNDRFGHPAGDEVLKHFTTFLRTKLRSADNLGRLGGEEFSILLPETKLDDALRLVRRISASLKGKQMESVAPGFTYTFSGGIAQLIDDASADCNWMLAAADKALYRAKTGGRNKVVAYRIDKLGATKPLDRK